jgi:hypothetical protein
MFPVMRGVSRGELVGRLLFAMFVAFGLGQWYVEGDQGVWTLFGWAFLTAGTAFLPLGEREHTPQDYPSRRQQVLIIAGCSLALVVGITTVGMPFVPRIM